MKKNPIDLHEIAREHAPATMSGGLRTQLLRAMEQADESHLASSVLPGELRHRMLQAMEQESAELQADAALERELREVYAAAPMSRDMRRRLPLCMQGAATRTPRVYVRRWAGVAAAVVLLAGVLIRFMPTDKPTEAAAMVKMSRQVTAAEDGRGTVRCDTFVMESADRSRLVIRVEEPEKSQLPDDVI